MADVQESTGVQGSQPYSGGAPHDKISNLIQFFRDTWAELHRVQWPTQQTVIKHTSVVVSTIIFMALYIGGLDAAITTIFQKVFHVGAG
ncbi:MAG: preprotein translocase subunit SecE [Armatimonadota bacterium]|nr:preprotein translocase subunit SecE [Armatimonadota bacterium]